MLQREKVLISELAFGMFITELDRPWLKSPFLLQGFLLDDEEDLNALKILCEYVYIDRTKSIGEQFMAESKANVAIQHEVSTIRIRTITEAPPSKKISSTTHAPRVIVKMANNQKKTIKQASFFEIISAIKQGSVTQTQEGIIFNVRASSDPHNSKTPPYPPTQPMQPDQSNDMLGFFKGLFSHSKEKLKTSVDTHDHNDDLSGVTESERFKISIYENEVPPVEQEIAVIYPTFEKSKLATKALFEAIANKQHLDISTVSDVLDTMVESISRTPDALMWLGRLKDTDDASYSQSLNVSINMMTFASFLAFPKAHIKDMGLAGLLQDLGKARIPKRILLKQSKLSMTEYELAKLHLEQSMAILEKTPNIPVMVMEMVLQHHERYDGSGYPNQLRENMISINGQIAGLIDTYCAITTDRTYAKGLHNQQALDIIHQLRGTQFSSELVDQLIQFLGIYPVSSLVELNTGEVAVVIQQNQVRRLQPRLMIILAPDKSKNAAPATIDLLHAPTAPDGTPYKIIKSVQPDDFGIHLEDFFL